MPKHKIVETTIPACHHRDAALVTTRTCVPKWLHVGIAAVLRRARLSGLKFSRVDSG